MPPLRRPDLVELETLARTAALGTVAAAAGELGVTRAAASKRLRNLEAIVGVALLHRTTQGVTLTVAGQAVLNAARAVLVQADELQATIAEIEGAPRDVLPAMRFLGGTATGPTPSVYASLRDAERLVSEIFHSSLLALAVTEPQSGLIVDANVAYTELSGIPVNELVGTTFEELGVTANPDVVHHVATRVATHGSITGLRAVLHRRGGESRTVEVSSWQSNVAGRPLLFWMLHDVTELQRVELEARGLFALTQHSSDYVSLANLGDKFSLLNAAGRALIGIAADADITAISPLDVITDETRRWLPEITPVLLETGTWSGRMDFLNLATGKVVPLAVRMLLTHSPGTGAPPLVALVGRPLPLPG